MMRKVFFFGLLSLAMLCCFSSCDRSASQKSVTDVKIPDAEKPVMSFQDSIYRFGTIKEGDEVAHEFAFTNTGKSDLLISNATASCGCTVPEWPKEPIPPGGKGVIKATFNSDGKQGKQSKKISITANTNPVTNEVVLEGDVIPKTTQEEKP